MTERLWWTAGDGSVLALDSPYIVTGITGTGGGPAEVQMQRAPFQDGSTVRDELIKERSVTIELMILASSRQELFVLRRALARVLSPKLGAGTLSWTDPDDTEWRLDAVPEAVEFPGGDASGPTWQRAVVSLLAAEPYWYRPGTLQAVSLEGGLGFPFQFPVSFAVVKSASLATNDGDVDAPVEITLVGPCLNPSATNLTTGKTLKVQYNVPSGYSIYINTAFGAKEVSLVAPGGGKTNIMNYFTSNSEFWSLVPGNNELQFAEEGSNPSALMLVSWRNRYVGR